MWLLPWWASSCSESFRLLVWQAENAISGQGLSRERSPVGSRFSELLFLDVPGTATEQVRACGFRRNSSSLDKAPKMRDSARLNSWESFLVTLPSNSSETWVMYSSAIPGLSVFCDWLFLVFSSASLETAANFLWLPKVSMTLREKPCQLRRLNWMLFVTKMSISSIMRGKGFNESKQFMMSNLVQHQRATIYIIMIVLSFLLFVPFGLAGNIIIDTPIEGTNTENYFKHFI